MEVTEFAILTGTIGQVLAVILYFARIFPLQLREAKVRDRLLSTRRVILWASLAFISISIFYMFVALYRYFIGDVPSFLVVDVFAYNGVGSLSVVLALYFIYTRKYTDD